MSEPIIRVENLSKRYIISHQNARGDGLRHRIEDMARAPFRWLGASLARNGNGGVKAGPKPPAREEFWALKDVSFEINRGDVVGIIGRNGAGKSTLLKVLSRIVEPTSGRITIDGRVASLLEVGTGFHAELTGRENIFLNGAILGMSKAEIRKKFDEIVAFAEIEKFLDTPVKRYSSGMYVRLAFAVAAHLEPEILIVDEVLAVGDSEFQKKCLGKMQDVSKGGRTVLFVSHNLSAVRRLCSRGLLLSRGRMLADENTEDCIRHYETSASLTVGSEWRSAGLPPESKLAFESLSVRLEGQQPVLKLNVECKFSGCSDHRPSIVAFDICDSVGSPIMQALPSLEPFITSDNSSQLFDFSVELPPLVPGNYRLSAWVGPHNSETYDSVRDCASFDVLDSPTPGRTFPHTPDHGLVVPISRFVIRRR